MHITRVTEPSDADKAPLPQRDPGAGASMGGERLPLPEPAE